MSDAWFDGVPGVSVAKQGDIPTYDNLCPWPECRKEIEDLFDLLSSSPGYGSGDCPWCSRPIYIETNIEYVIYKGEGDD